MVLQLKLLLNMYINMIILTLTLVKGQKILTIPADGRTPEIGHLYSDVTSEITARSVFSGAINDSIRTLDIPFTASKFALTRTTDEKSALLGISADFSVEVKITGVEGYGSVSAKLDMKITSKKEDINSAFNLETDTVKEFIDVPDAKLANILDPGAITTDYTHVVVGLSYGVQVVVQITGNKNKINYTVTGKAGFAYAVKTVFGPAGDAQQFTKEFPGDLKDQDDLKVDVTGDALIDKEKYPTTLADAIEFIRNFPTLAHEVNAGKGVIRKIHLMPISSFVKAMQSVRQASADGRMNELSAQLPTPCPSFTPNAQVILGQVDIANELTLRLRDIVRQIYSHRFVFNNAVFERLENIQVQLQEAIDTQRMMLRSEILRGRRSRADVALGRARHGITRVKIEAESTARVDNLMNDYNKELRILDGLIDSSFKDELLKLEMVRWMLFEGAAWVGRGDSVEPYIFRYFETDVKLCTIHYFPQYALQPRAFVQAIADALQVKNFKPLVVDCDFDHETCAHMPSREILCVPVHMKKRNRDWQSNRRKRNVPKVEDKIEDELDDEEQCDGKVNAGSKPCQ